MDGDLNDDPAELPNVVAPMISGGAHLLPGTRTQVAPGALAPQQITGNRVTLVLIALLRRRRPQELPSFMAVRRDVLQQLDLRERTYGRTREPLVKATKAHVRIVEMPTHYRKRGGGQSEVAGTLRGTLGAGYFILKVVLRYAR